MTSRTATVLHVLGIGALVAAITGCNGSTPTAPTPSPAPNCTFTVGDAPAGAMAATGAEFTIAITTEATCSWSASSSSAFITGVGSMSGTGNGTVRFAVQSNSGAARPGSVVVAGRVLQLQQDAGSPHTCDIVVSPTEAAVVKQGADVAVDVTVTQGDGCTWTAAGNDPFIAVKEGASGTGTGHVVLAVGSNAGAARVGTALVAGRTITILQETALPDSCTFAVSPAQVTAASSGASSAITITMTQGSNCPWLAASQSPFISIAGASSGIGSGQVTLSVASNAGAARTGTVLVAGQTVTVNQNAAAVSSGPVAVLSYQSDPGDYIGAGQSHTYVKHGSEFTVVLDATHGELRFSLPPVGGDWWNLTLAARAGQTFGLGLYDTTGRWPFQAATQPGLDFSGSGRGCNESTGRFLITEAVFGPGNTVERFHAGFEQHCEGWSVALRGEIWIDSQGAMPTSPVPALPPGPATPTTFFSFQSDPGDYVGGGGSGTYTLATTKFHAVASDSRPAVNIYLLPPVGGAFHWNLDFSAASGVRLQPGTYTGATRYPFASGVPGLSVASSGVCSSLTGSFVVLEASYGPQGEVLKFHATFEQHCDGAVPGLRGEVFIVANPWK